MLRYEEIIKDVLSTTQKIDENEDLTCATVVTNIQSSAVIVDEGYILPLKSIVSSLSGAAKYNLTRFAANIIRFFFGVHVTTCMLFEAGKIVVIGSLTVEHSRYATQMYRLMLSNVTSRYYNKETNTIVRSNLVNRTRFKNFGIHNIAAKTNIGYNITLKTFKDQLARDTNFDPELFPGLPIIVWVSPKQDCRCVSKKDTKTSCACTVNTSLFDSGEIIITGSKKIQNTNKAKHIVLNFCKDLKNPKKLVPREKRFESRRQYIFNTSFENSGYIHKRSRRKINKLSYKELYGFVKPIKRNTSFNHIENMFVRACMLCHIGMVRHLLSIDDQCINNALDYIDKVKEKNVFMIEIERILKEKRGL